MQLGTKHDRYCLAKKRNGNVSLYLIIDDNYEDLKMMHCVATEKIMENSRDRRTTTMQTSRAMMKEKDTLNTCENMLRHIRARYNVMKNEMNKVDQNENEEEGCVIDACNDGVVLEKFNKKERSCKP